MRVERAADAGDAGVVSRINPQCPKPAGAVVPPYSRAGWHFVRFIR